MGTSVHVLRTFIAAGLLAAVPGVIPACEPNGTLGPCDIEPVPSFCSEAGPMGPGTGVTCTTDADCTASGAVGWGCCKGQCDCAPDAGNAEQPDASDD